MNIYFENDKKYIRLADFAIEYSEAKKIFHLMYPRFVKSFITERQEISQGFQKFVDETYYGLEDAFETDEFSSVFVLFKLTNEVFPEFERLLSRKRILKREHNESEWQLRLIEFNHRCAYCGNEGKLEKDHVMPVSKGGSDKITNIVPSCRHCNASKHDKIIS